MFLLTQYQHSDCKNVTSQLHKPFRTAHFCVELHGHLEARQLTDSIKFSR